MAGPNTPGPERRTDWQEPFLEQFRMHGVQAYAAAHAGIGVWTVNQERKRDADFALRYNEALEHSTATLERQGFQWASVGLASVTVRTKTYVNADGVTVTETTRTESTERSPALLIFLLKSRRPDIYRDNIKVETSGTLEVTVPEEQADAAVDDFTARVVRLADARRARADTQSHSTG